MRGSIYLLLLWAGTCGPNLHVAQAQTLDRRALVEGAYRLFAPALIFCLELPEAEKLAPQDRALLREVLEEMRTNRPELRFDPVPQNFARRPDQFPRLMESAPVPGAPIYINEAMLNDSNRHLDLALIFKFLFHEVGHKTGEREWEVRDRAAQYFERSLTPYIRSKGQLVFFSLPASRVDSELGTEPEKGFLPTFMVFWRSATKYFEITEQIVHAFKPTAGMLRSIWTEANNTIYGVYAEFGELVRGVIQAQHLDAIIANFAKAGHPFSLDEFISGGFQLKELELLELLTSEQARFDSGDFVILKGMYTITRVRRRTFHIEIQGFPWHDEFHSPINIQLFLPKDMVAENQAKVAVQVRPQADYTSSIKIEPIERESRHDKNYQLEVELPERTDKAVHLSIGFETGHLLIPARAIYRKDSRWLARFEIPPDLVSLQQPLVAESILIDGQVSMYLESLLNISSGTSGRFSPPYPDRLEVEPGSLGFWGLLNGTKTFFNHFEFDRPAVILDNLHHPEHFSLNPSRLDLEFILSEETKLREIRVYFRRSLNVAEPDEGKDQVLEVMIDGESRRVAAGGKARFTRDVTEVLSVTAENIFREDLPDGRQRVRARLQLPFREARPLGPKEAHYIPVGYPIMVEIVTNDFRVLHHYFGTGNCPSMLNAASSARHGPIGESDNEL